jgi:predicted transcriptional regulator
MQVNIIEKKARVSLKDIVKFQILTHCYLNKIALSESELDCLALLSIERPAEITEFCNKVAENNIFKSCQTARNCLAKLEKLGLVVKEGKNKKILHLAEGLSVHHEGNIVYNVKFGYSAIA